MRVNMRNLYLQSAFATPVWPASLFYNITNYSVFFDFKLASGGFTYYINLNCVYITYFQQ